MKTLNKKTKRILPNPATKFAILDLMARKAHAHTIHNETEILHRSRLCGCCSCESMYPASGITKDDLLTELGGEWTVWCPECGIDGVFGDGCGIKPTPTLLRRMRLIYFCGY